VIECSAAIILAIAAHAEVIGMTEVQDVDVARKPLSVCILVCLESGLWLPRWMAAVAASLTPTIAVVARATTHCFETVITATAIFLGLWHG
jgi:hypothetical protein